MKLYCSLELCSGFACAGQVGSDEIFLVGNMELTVRYHSGEARILTRDRKPVREQFQVGSLTGAVAS